MAQVTSGFSTEGTQYAQNNSFYLLDTVPGSGVALTGPLTITGNLTVTGTTTSIGNLGATSVNTNSITAGPSAATYSASGSLAISSATVADLTAPVVGVSATGGTLTLGSPGAGSLVMNPAAVGGAVNLTAAKPLTVTTQGVGAAGAMQFTSSNNFQVNANTNIGLISAAGGVGINGPTGVVATCQSKALILSTDIDVVTTGFGARIQGTRMFLDRGLALGSNQGTFASPAVAIQEAPPTPPFAAPYVFTMTTNKAVITTGAGALQLRILFPTLGGLGETQWQAVVGQVGTTATNVLATDQNGSQILLVSNNPLGAVITVYIHIL